MKLSVAIATNGHPRLSDAIRSAAGADEILVLHNGASDVPHSCKGLPVKSTYRDGIGGVIGAAKRAAFQACTGDAVIELDHDDLLMPGAVAAVRAAFESGADFVYSDFAEFHDPGYTPNPYGSAFGWQGYPVVLPVDGEPRALIAMRAPPFTAHNVRRIEWAPNHLRAWRRDFYDRIGGHNAALAVCDDHDLLLRTYLAGAKTVHIPECLYAYRVHPTQTVQQRNALIQSETARLYNENREALAREHARRAGLLAVDLCGGRDKGDGWANLDLLHGHDLDERWPLADGSVGVLRANDAIEHLRDPTHTWREAFRVLAPGGWFLSQTPSTDGRGAWQDPTHVSFWNANSFWYVTRSQQQQYVAALAGVRFGVACIRDHFPSKWHELHRIPYVQADLIRLGEGYHHYGRLEI